MNISIQKGEAFLNSTSEENARNAEAGRDKPVVAVAVGDLRIQLTKQEASDLADVLIAWKDVAWRVS